VETAAKILDVSAAGWAHVIESDDARSTGKEKWWQQKSLRTSSGSLTSTQWLIAATVALAAFMEVLDTSISNEPLRGCF
jgi:hypothetical protein